MSYNFNNVTISGSLGVNTLTPKVACDVLGVSNSALTNSTFGIKNVVTFSALQNTNTFCIDGSQSGQYVYFSSVQNNSNTVVYYSSNYGQSFYLVPGFSNSSKAYSSVSTNSLGDTLLAFQGSSVYKMTGYNNSLVSTASLASFINCLVLSFNAGQTVGNAYAVTSSTIFISTDSGTTFTNLSLAGNWNCIDVSVDGTQFCAGNNSTLCYSTTSGTSLATCNGTPSGKNWISINVCKNGNNVYAVENTTNTVWSSSTGVSGTFTQIITNAMSSPIVSNPKTISASANGQYLIAVSSVGIQHSENYGITWTNSSNPNYNGTTHVYYISDSSAFYFAQPSGIFYQVFPWMTNSTTSKFSVSEQLVVNSIQPSNNSNAGGIVMPNGGLAIGLSTDAVNSTNGGGITNAGGLAVGKTGYFGSNLYSNGTYLVPSFFCFARDTNNTSTNSTIAQNRLTLTTGSVPAGVYTYKISGIITSTGTNNFTMQVSIDGSVSKVLQSSISIIGNGQTLDTSDVISLSAGVHNISLQYFSSTNTRYIAINTPVISFYSVA